MFAWKRINFILSFFVFILTIILLTVPVFADTFYVSVDGQDNSALDGSINQEWATVNYALSQCYDGDIIKIKPGEYTLTKVIDISGLNNITITAFDLDNKPILVKDSENLLRINSGADYTTISYLVLDNGDRRSSWWNGIVKTEASYTHIHNNEIRDGFSGIEIRGGHSHEINNNEIHNLGTSGRAPDQGTGMGIGVYKTSAQNWEQRTYIHHNNAYDAGGDSIHIMNSEGVNYIEIAYNDFHHNEEDAIDVKNGFHLRIHHNSLHDNAANGYVTHKSIENGGDGYTSNMEFYANKVYDNGWYGMVIKGSESHDLKIYNNIFYGNCHTPASWGADAVKILGTNNAFYFNIVFNNSTPNGESNVGLRGGASDTKVVNNIFYNNGATSWGNIHTSFAGTVDHNYVYPSAGLIGTNAITTETQVFTNAESGDFSLPEGSPLINAGIDVGILEDMEGDNRIQDGIPDLGALEFNRLSTQVFDINNDSVVNIQDVILCVNVVLGIDSDSADVNSDGITNVQDVITIVNEILGSF